MGPEFSYATRKEGIASLDGQIRDVAIIGGGITGSGVANLLAQNNISTVLLEKKDFASGTSAGSSKLIHGGLRYLAQGHFILTRHLLKERNYLLRNAGFVNKLEFDILIDRHSWGRTSVGFGLFLYSILGGSLRLPRMIRNKGEYPPDVKGYFRYYDAYSVDSVLVIHNIVSAVKHGAQCINYAGFTGIVKENGFYRINFKDHTSGREHSFLARYVVNCAGPWVREVAGILGVPDHGIFRLSKGVHLIFRKKHANVKRAIAFRTHIDGRQMFVIPAGKVTIVGTTDTFTDDPDDFSVTGEDIHYIVESAKRLLPKITEKNVLTSYAGIRPLFGTGESPGEISRDFYIDVSGNIISIFGGKLTDYRNVARKACRLLSRISDLNIKTSGLPVIDYSRPEKIEGYGYYIDHECAITPEDVYRRRTASSLYDPEFSKTEEEIRKSFLARSDMPVPE